jgi:hypothetical protein
MKPREAYVRVSKAISGIEYIVGLELRHGESIDYLYLQVAAFLSQIATYGDDSDDRSRAEAIEAVIKHKWPDRAYFIEVCSDGKDEAWVQIYQPWTETTSGQ